MELRLKDKAFIIMLAVVFLFLVLGKLMPHTQPKEMLTPVQIGATKVMVEEVFTDFGMYKGLGDRQQLGENQGMLFLHDGAAKHPYVMRGMKFPLDFIFIKDNKVVDIAEKVPVEFQGTVVGATEYDRVLEVNAGFVERHGIHLGNDFSFIKE